DQHHRYLLRRTMATLTIRVLDERDRPCAGEPYRLIIHEWKEFSGALDGDGQLHHEIPATAEEGRLFLFPPQRPEETIELRIAHLDPINETSGVKGRLNNLGYYTGPIDDDATTPEFRSAIMAHQHHEKLERTGELDGTTRQSLEAKHRC
ncbi:MAG: peptidoglycan-binding domain-containing protein, partial [Gemmataceae bacterium]